MNNHMAHLKQTFKQIEYAPRQSLAADIIAKIRKRQEEIGRRRFWTFSALGLASLGLTIPAAILLGNQIAQSGFLQYLSLAGTSALTNSGTELASTILSALPITGIVAVFATLLGFTWSIRKAFILPRNNFA